MHLRKARECVTGINSGKIKIFQQSREYFIEETHRKTVQINEMEGAIQNSFN